MKEIIKRVLFCVVAAVLIISVAYKFLNRGAVSTTDPYGTTNGVIDGTDVNGLPVGTTNPANSGSVNNPGGQNTTAPGQQNQGDYAQQTTNGGNYAPNSGQPSGNTVQTPGQQNQGGVVDSSTSGGNKIDRYQNIFKSGKFLMKINDPDLGPVTMAMSGNKMFLDASMEGLSLKMIYDGDKKDEDNPENGTWFIVIDSIKKYSPLPADMIGDMNVEEMTKDFATTDDNVVYTKTVEDVNGELLEVESCVDANGNTTKYYFRGDELVRSDSVSPSGAVSITEFQLITGDVADSVFEIPSGYAKWNISWLINMLS